MKSFRVAIVGATGAVGQIALSLLVERRFPFSHLRLFASERSLGKEIKVGSGTYPCETLTRGCFRDCDIVFFDAADEISSAWVDEAVQSGAWVIDNSSVNRMRDDVLLAIPEVNGNELGVMIRDAVQGKRKKLIAGPNCSTAALVVALKPVQQAYGLKRVIVSTYQSVSGAGAQAVRELLDSTQTLLPGALAGNREYRKVSSFKHPIAFSVIPHIGSFSKDPDKTGSTSEEVKIREETRKLLGMNQLPVFATAVRVPTIRCHAGSVWIETEKPVELEALRNRVRDFPGLEMHDAIDAFDYPVTAAGDGRDPVLVGRYRIDRDSGEKTLGFWFVSDNLRKGAALNAIQIAENIARHLSS